MGQAKSLGGWLPHPLLIICKEVDKMTAIVCTKSLTGLAIAADTWNTTKNPDKYIRKIAYNKYNKIIIGQAWDNSIILEDSEQIVYMLDLMQKMLR